MTRCPQSRFNDGRCYLRAVVWWGAIVFFVLVIIAITEAIGRLSDALATVPR